VHEGDKHAADDVHQEEDADVIEANLADLVRTNKGVTISVDDEEDEEDEDDAIFEYYSDTDANGNGVHDDVAKGDDDDDGDL